MTITSLSTTIGAVILAWIAYKQAQLSRIVKEVHQQTNHIKDELVASTAKASEAQGKIIGRTELKAELYERAASGAKPPVIEPPA